MRREINQHDIITKKVLSKKTYAVDFLANALPRKLTSKLDFSKLKVEKGDFIDAENKERFTDILYSVPTRKTSQKLGIFCLVEHKSTRDKDIHSQLLLYLAGIYKTHRWPVIPLVLYHGKKKWDIPTNFASSLVVDIMSRVARISQPPHGGGGTGATLIHGGSNGAGFSFGLPFLFT